MKPPTPPPCRIIREGGCSGVCHICGSSLKRRWFGLGKIIGCLQPKCWNWHGWSYLPTGHNRPIDLYGAPEKPPYGLPTPKRYPPMPAAAPPCELRAALTKIRTAGYNWDPTAQWMQKVAANALEPGKWPEPGEQPATPQPPTVKPSMAWQLIETAPKDGRDIVVGVDMATVWIVRSAWYRGPEVVEQQPEVFDESDIGWWSYIHSVTQEKLEGMYEPTHWLCEVGETPEAQ